MGDIFRSVLVIAMLSSTFNEFKKNKNKLIILILITSLFYFPILYAGAHFQDDVARATVYADGFYWNRLGRFLATAVAKLYSSNLSFIVDCFPLSWFLIVFLYGLSAYLIYLKIDKIDKINSFAIACIFIINPFFISNFLYRFDSLGMGFAIFFSVAAFSLNLKKGNILISIILLIISLNFYQSTINLFLSLICVQLILMSLKGNNQSEIFKILFISILIYIAASVLYLIEIKLFNSVNSRSTTLSLSLSGLILLFKNFLNASKPFIEFWKFYDWFIYPIIPFLFYSLIIILKRRLNFLRLIVLCLTLFFSFAGGLAILKEGASGTRVLNYFPTILMVLFIVLSVGCNKFKYLILIPIFACFIFSFRVGNMLKIQGNFEKPIFCELTIDIYKQKDIDKFYSIGAVPLSNYVRNLQRSTPFNGFLARSSWRAVGLLWEYVPRNKVFLEWFPENTEKIFLESRKNKTSTLILEKKPFYCIYSLEGKGYIDWGCKY